MIQKLLNTIIIIALVILLPIYVEAYNYEHVNVTTTANITNAGPEILEININQDITLNAGGEKTIYCNSTIRDWNGWDDIITVNATLYHSTSQSNDADNNNTHYTNASCTFAQQDAEPFIADATCSFDLLHYANNGTWTCNITVEDTYSFQDSLTNTTTITELYALNVTDTIDYGDLAVLDYSAEIPSTVTNFGNADINVSVLGYGAVEGDGLGLVCEAGSNITVENQRFSTAPATPWASKIPLSDTYQDVGITLLQPTDLTTPVTSTMYWELYVPPNPFGECNGTIRFTATTP